MEDMFRRVAEKSLSRNAPLAVRMRPRTLDEFEEQISLVGPGRPLRQLIKSDGLQSVIFFGPPGTGKTTLAHIIAGMTSAHFEKINAVMAGVADIRKVVEEAKDRLALYGRRTVLFIDEIHRFNKAQQDALLPFVEDGTVVLVGSTTENPMFAVNRPLLSRSLLYRLEPLSNSAVARILRRALEEERGLGNYRVQLENGVIETIAGFANGDARAALNVLELAVLTTVPDEDGVRKITMETVKNVCQNRVIQFDREDEHYDVISAFIKSMRGSDPQAALYWLARLLHAGDDPVFIARRIMILAAEDIGLADPRALVVATSTAQAVQMIGMPEARIILAEAAVYMALAPKSNSTYMGIEKALETVRNEKIGAVPVHLRDTNYSGAKTTLGHGKGYKYPHNYPNHWVKQQYLPVNIKDKIFYEPSSQTDEKKLWETWQKRKNLSDND